MAGLFVLDKHIVIQPDGTAALDEESLLKLDLVLASFVTALRRSVLGAEGTQSVTL